jgi:hypothetical protein
VHNYSNRSSAAGDGDAAGRMALANSGARVQLFGSTGLLAEFTVPNAEGTLWTVFTLDGETITPVNSMSFVVDPDASPPPGIVITARRAGASSSRIAAAKRAKAMP